MKALYPFEEDGMKSLMLWANDFKPYDWLSVCWALGLPENTMEIELRVKIIATSDYIRGNWKKKALADDINYLKGVLEMNVNANSVINTVPAAKALHHVPLFDPLKLLRKTTSAKTGEKVLKLDLSHKKMWFLLVHPRGRMLTNILRLTDQMAIFEAQLFADRSDNTVLAQFTSCHTRSESGPQYIRNAQEEALNEALDNAGFGIQLSDLVESSGNGYGSEVLLSQVEALLREPEKPTPAQTAAPVPVMPLQTAATQTPPVAPVQVKSPMPTQAEAPAPVCEAPKPSVQTVVEAPVTQPVEEAAPVVEPAPAVEAAPAMVDTPHAAAAPADPTPACDTEPAEVFASEPDTETLPEEPVTSNSTETANILQMLGGIPAAAVEPATEPAAEPEQAERPTVVPFPNVESPIQTAEPVQQSVTPAAEPVMEAAAAYTEDMTVDEIRARMTSEQAKALTVSFGPNKGWTLGQVLERRPSSLRFYALASKDANNALKAGSLLLLDEQAQARAG